MTIETTIIRVRAFARSRGWTRSRLAKEAGLTESTLRHFHDPAWNPTADTLRKLEAVIPDGWAPAETDAEAPA